MNIPDSSTSRGRVVGIAGGTASGKSTLADALARALAPQRCRVLGMDRFFRAGNDGAPTLRFSLRGGEEVFDYNHLDSVDNDRLAAEIDAVARGASSDGEAAPDVLIVEGLMLLAVPALSALCDLRVFVELDADVRLARRLLRDMDSQRRYTAPRDIVGYYLESARGGHGAFVEPSRAYADLIVRGDADFARLAPLLAAALSATKELRR